jgi:hypothetical protein
MKSIIHLFAIVAVIVLALPQLSSAQMPPPPRPRGDQPPPPREDMPPLPNDQEPPPPPREKDGRATALSTYTGTVKEFVANPDFIYDAFLLTIDSKETRVAFPKHLGEQVLQLAKKGQTVSVTGFYDEKHREGGFGEKHQEGGSDEKRKDSGPEFRLVSLTSGTTTLRDTPPVQPAQPPVPTAVTLQSSIAEFLHDPEGRINGVMLKDGTLVRVPPHVGYQLLGSLKAGDEIKVYGYVKPKRGGEVYSKDVKVVGAETITINGTEYLVR